MKRYIWILIGVMFALPVAAQQIPLYSQYNINPFLYNPARTGQRDGLNANLIYRKMWTSIPGAPQTAALTLDGSLVNNKVGLGGIIYQDNTGIIQRVSGNLSYAYHIKLKEDMHLSLGVSAGVVHTRINWQAAQFGDTQVDPSASNGPNSGVAFDASAGINYQYKGLNVGFSVPQLFNSKAINLVDKNHTGYQLGRHYLVNASYEIPIKSIVYIEPMAMFRTETGKNFQIDAGATFSYKHIVWLSAMYRYNYAVTVGAGVKIHDRFSLGYAYDITINGLKSYGGGTHEVFVGVKFGKQKDEGIVEEIKKLKEGQQNHDERILKLEQRTDTLDQKTKDLKDNQDKLQKDEEQLKNDVNTKNKTIEELQEQVNKLVKGMVAADSAKTGKNQVDLPPDLIYRGKKEDLEFIMGKPDANYFMVVSSVRTEAMARQIAKGMIEKGEKVGVVYNKKRTWYYIFLNKPGGLEDGIKELYKIRKQTQYKDAWIHIYD